MDRRESLAILAALALGGYLAVSDLLADGSPTSALLGVSRTEGTRGYGAGDYGTGEYGE